MTAAQLAVRDYVRDYIAQHSFAPTISEIAVNMGTKSKSVAFRMVEALIVGGHLRRTADKTRNLAMPVGQSTATDLAAFSTEQLLGEVRRRMGDDNG